VKEVILIDDADSVYEKLGKEVERTKDKRKLVLFNTINKTLELLEIDPEVGIPIRKNRIPYKYIEKYKVTNLWKINLSGYWRLIYTINTTQVKIINLVLDIFDHKKYNKLFKYK